MSLTIQALPVAAIVKTATKSLHTEVEDLLLPKLSSIASADDYAAVLKMFYGYFSPLQEKISKHLSDTDLPDLAERRTADLILSDLEALDLATTNLPLCDDLPIISNNSQAFGALYVMEGSTLGGKMIAKMLEKNPAFPVSSQALHFFLGYKEETGRRWKGFLSALDRQPDPTTVAAAANDTFTHLKRWIQHSFNHDEHT